MKKEEIVGESAEQQETIEEYRSQHEINKELDDVRYAIEKEIQYYVKKEKKIDLLETHDRAKRTPKTKLLINHIKKLRKLHEKQSALYDEFLKYKLIK
jgi:hypothetical protein